MKKKIMSIIAATAVMITSSPICANALYKEVISKQDYSDYVKVDFMSDEKADVYIYNGNDIDENAPYRRNAIREEKMNDRIYLNVKEGITASELGGLLKEFRTENGDSLQIYANNSFNKEFSYYITPSVFKTNEPLKQISSNDARKVKELLTKDDFVTDVVYTSDVCNPANGVMDLTYFYYPNQYYKEKDDDKKNEIKAETEQIISNYVSDNNLDISLEFVPKGENTAHISVIPNTNLSLNEILLIAEQIIDNCNIYPEVGWQVSTNEDFSAVDLLNAVDGDTNCDAQMDMADAVLIMQALANPNKYSISAQGSFNADLNGDGITVGDAQAIQTKLLGLDKKSTSQSADESVLAGKTYIYEKDGQGGHFTITLNDNGKYAYYEGGNLSYMIMGTWEKTEDMIVLTELTDDPKPRINWFKFSDGDMVFLEEKSDNFSSVKVNDGEKFTDTGIRNKVEWYSDFSSELVERDWNTDEKAVSSIIKSTNELKNYLDNFYREKVISEYLEKYDDSFFNDNVLLMNTVYQSSGTGARYMVNATVGLNGDIGAFIMYNGNDSNDDLISVCLAQIIVPKDAFNDSQSEKWGKYNVKL